MGRRNGRVFNMTQLRRFQKSEQIEGKIQQSARLGEATAEWTD